MQPRHVIVAFLIALAASFTVAVLSSCSTPQTSSSVSEPPQSPSAPPSLPFESKPQLEPGPAIKGCPTFAFNAVDVAEPVTQAFLDAMKKKGVKLIIRYGDHPNETIKGKTPKAAELELIRKNGFQFLAVFQHNNRWAHYTTGAAYDTFRSAAASRGKLDAERMRELYPKARSWYYGVDFDAYTKEQLAGVETYAREFKKVADKYGKPVGAYGGGTALEMLAGKGLITYKWISMSTGFSGTAALTQSGRFHLLQKLWKEKCAGLSLDADVMKEADVGQWGLE